MRRSSSSRRRDRLPFSRRRRAGDLLPHLASSGWSFRRVAYCAGYFIETAFFLIRRAALRSAGDLAHRLRDRFVALHLRFKIGEPLTLRAAFLTAGGGSSRSNIGGWTSAWAENTGHGHFQSDFLFSLTG